MRYNNQKRRFAWNNFLTVPQTISGKLFRTCKIHTYHMYLFTLWGNQMGTAFAKMSSWTDLTRHLGMETTFQTKNIKSKYVWVFIKMILIHYSKMHTNTTVALKPNFMSSFLLCAVFLLIICIFLLRFKILILIFLHFILLF